MINPGTVSVPVNPIDSIAVIDEMISEVEQQARRTPQPPSGGPRQAPDGDALGRFIRYAILHEVRDRLTGTTTPPKAVIEAFNALDTERPGV